MHDPHVLRLHFGHTSFDDSIQHIEHVSSSLSLTSSFPFESLRDSDIERSEFGAKRTKSDDFFFEEECSSESLDALPLSFDSSSEELSEGGAFFEATFFFGATLIFLLRLMGIEKRSFETISEGNSRREMTDRESEKLALSTSSLKELVRYFQRKFSNHMQCVPDFEKNLLKAQLMQFYSTLNPYQQ